MILKKSVRAKWVAALRSGEYQQAKGVLTELDNEHQPVGHCCLGVLSELCQQDTGALSTGWRAEDKQADEEGRYQTVPARSYNDCTTMPPPAVGEWAGVPTPRYADWTVTVDRDEDGRKLTVFLADRNDRGATFEEIADLIEDDLDAEHDSDD